MRHSGNVNTILCLQSANKIQHVSRMPRMSEFFVHPHVTVCNCKTITTSKPEVNLDWASNSNFPVFTVILDRKQHADWQNLILCEKQVQVRFSCASSYCTLLLLEELSWLVLINASDAPWCNRLETNSHHSAFSFHNFHAKISILSGNKFYPFACSSVRFSFPFTSESYQTMKCFAFFCVKSRNGQLVFGQELFQLVYVPP